MEPELDLLVRQKFVSSRFHMSQQLNMLTCQFVDILDMRYWHDEQVAASSRVGVSKHAHFVIKVCERFFVSYDLAKLAHLVTVFGIKLVRGVLFDGPANESEETNVAKAAGKFLKGVRVRSRL